MIELPPTLVAALRGVKSVGVITGAGVSAESGIRTYRGSGGIYDDPEEGDRTIEALTGSTLRRDPDRTWRTVAALARQSQRAEPNAAHRAIVEIEQTVARFVLMTQNVDGLHQRAGSRNVIDIHGHVFETVCMSCRAHGRYDQFAAVEAAPRCQACGGILRPDVVLFGELLDVDKIAAVRQEFYDRPLDLVLIAGTTALFPYILEPVRFARAQGRLTVEVNLEETVLSEEVEHSLRGRAGEVLPAIAAALVRP